MAEVWGLQAQALQIYQEIGDQESVATVLNNRSIDLTFVGKYAQAEQAGRQALQISQQIGDLWTEAIARGSLAFTLRQLGENEAAREHVEKAVAITIELGNGTPRIDGGAFESVDEETAKRLVAGEGPRTGKD